MLFLEYLVSKIFLASSKSSYIRYVCMVIMLSILYTIASLLYIEKAPCVASYIVFMVIYLCSIFLLEHNGAPPPKVVWVCPCKATQLGMNINSTYV